MGNTTFFLWSMQWPEAITLVVRPLESCSVMLAPLDKGRVEEQSSEFTKTAPGGMMLENY